MRLRMLAAAVTMLLAQAATAQASIDLAIPQRSVRIDGEPSTLTGNSVASAGDVNGDGVPDIVIGAPFADANGRTDSGSAFVVYGGQGAGPIDLHNLGTRGFRIDGAANGDAAGAAVAAAGDINGDGIDDVVVGAVGAQFGAGAAYVIYGQRTADPGDVDLRNLDTREFRFAGLAGNLSGVGDSVGSSLAAAGDVNDDGIDDLLVGAAGLDGSNGRNNAGGAYVIYGQKVGDLPDIGAGGLVTNGMKIAGAATEDHAGSSVAAADVNGDGVADLIVGAPTADNNGRTDSGSTYVVFGQRLADPTDLDLASLGNRGFRIDGQASGDLAGGSVGGGDVNGDGVADVLLGARAADNNGRVDSGSTYAVYGVPGTGPPNVDLQSLGASGFRIDGAAAGDEAGQSVAFAGDLNGDGVGDAVLGAPDASAASRANSGAAFIVNGTHAADPADLDLASQGGGELEIEGLAGALAGASVAASSDLNGDGRPDLLVGAPGLQATFLIDASGPDTIIDSAPAARSQDTTPTFSFHASEANATFECSIDRGSPSFGPCSGPGASETPAKALADGTYTFRVAALDASLNPDPVPATATFTVDTSPPQTTIRRHPRRKLALKPHRRSARATFKFASSEPGSTFKCKLDKRRPVACASPKHYALKRGRHTFKVFATDAVGNRDATPAVFRVKVGPAAKK